MDTAHGLASVQSRVAAKVLTGLGPLVAVAMFAAAVPLIHFGSMVKPYSVDVLVAVLLMWLAIELGSQTMTSLRRWAAGVAGAVLMWFSQPAAIIAAGLGVALVFLSKPTDREGLAKLRRLAPSLILWGASAAAATLAMKAAMPPPLGGVLKDAWPAGFPPATLSEFRATLWPLDRLKWLFADGDLGRLCYPFPAFYVALTAGGIVVLWKRNREFAVLLTGLLFVGLAAAVARKYPFSDRLILYLVPGFLIAIAASVEWIRQRASSIAPLLGPVSVLLLVGPTIFPVAKVPPPYRTEEMKPVLSYVEARRHPDDAVYVYNGALQAVTYYGPRYGLDNEAYSIGRDYRGNNRCDLENLDTFRSLPRVWVLLTRASDEYRARDDILGYLDTIGVRRESFSVPSRAPGRRPPPAEAFLYDLSDARRAGRATAMSFPLAVPSSDPEVECGRRMLTGDIVQRWFDRAVERRQSGR